LGILEGWESESGIVRRGEQGGGGFCWVLEMAEVEDFWRIKS
jgi:hypothetical protein